ncbi:hypothetical protein LSH36_674g01033 [Paralvinella palmiformis]|uniref:Uncharacterized protein n=1 Tax=Paralvinella palmiformis TaxID=53620 RepID=A0AAD9MWG7_9ANNE|nr:hypothetical protein LSH36_674g01033 [Paralvinella palmiformis]
MEIGETTKETGNDQQTDEMDTDWLIMHTYHSNRITNLKVNEIGSAFLQQLYFLSLEGVRLSKMQMCTMLVVCATDVTGLILTLYFPHNVVNFGFYRSK